MITDNRIQELLDLEDIEENESKFESEFGYYPFNISTWNPTEYFSNKYLLNKVMLTPFNYIPYIYSYELEPKIVSNTMTKIGGTSEMGGLFTNSGTNSITLVISVLKALGIKHILVISPCYYAVFHNCLQKNIKITEIYAERIKQSYKLPYDEILNNIDDIQAIWITNPIYNTGVYYSDEDIAFLQSKIPSDIFIICDECFSLTGKGLTYNLKNRKKFISINDPLKSIMINGLKFSLIIYNSQYKELFEHWSDIICGSLSYSTIQSIAFYNTPKFDDLNNNLIEHFYRLRNKIRSLMLEFPSASIDLSTDGHIIMCYFPNLPYNLLQDKDIMYKFIKQTGTSIIPGNRFHFSKLSGFCFRINLGRECNEFFDALYRILKYFSD